MIRSSIIQNIETGGYPALADGADTPEARSELRGLLASAHQVGLPYNDHWRVVMASLASKYLLDGEKLKAIPELIRQELLALDERPAVS